MKNELEMLSKHIGRGLLWLGGAFHRFVEAVTPSHAPGEDVVFTH